MTVRSEFCCSGLGALRSALPAVGAAAVACAAMGVVLLCYWYVVLGGCPRLPWSRVAAWLQSLRVAAKARMRRSRASSEAAGAGELVSVEEIRAAFELFDADGSGSIDYKELGAAMRALGLDMAEASLLAVAKQLDADGSGSIEFPEFLRLMRDFIKPVDESNESRKSIKPAGDGNESIHKAGDASGEKNKKKRVWHLPASKPLQRADSSNKLKRRGERATQASGSKGAAAEDPLALERLEREIAELELEQEIAELESNLRAGSGQAEGVEEEEDLSPQIRLEREVAQLEAELAQEAKSVTPRQTPAREMTPRDESDWDLGVEEEGRRPVDATTSQLLPPSGSLPAPARLPPPAETTQTV